MTHILKLWLLNAFFFCSVLTGTAYGQQRYDTCKVFQFLDSDSSFLENIVIKDFSRGRLITETSVHDLENQDAYIVCKRLKGVKIFKGKDTTRVVGMRRFYFVNKEYHYDKAGVLQSVTRLDDAEGTFSNEHTLYEYGQGGKLIKTYELNVSHDLIHGVTVHYYVYNNGGVLISDSSIEDRRLVVNYQWDEENSKLFCFSKEVADFVPVTAVSNLQFQFSDEQDTINRRTVAKNYCYFDGGYETRSLIYLSWDTVRASAYDSVWTNKSGQPLRSATYYESKLHIVRHYYYNSAGDRVRVVIDNDGAESTGRITRIYTYAMKKAKAIGKK